MTSRTMIISTLILEKLFMRRGRLSAGLGSMTIRHASKYITRVTDRRNLEASNELFMRSWWRSCTGGG